VIVAPRGKEHLARAAGFLLGLGAGVIAFGVANEIHGAEGPSFCLAPLLAASETAAEAHSGRVGLAELRPYLLVLAATLFLSTFVLGCMTGRNALAATATGVLAPPLLATVVPTLLGDSLRQPYFPTFLLVFGITVAASVLGGAVAAWEVRRRRRRSRRGASD
jgi:hypothetical protein